MGIKKIFKPKSIALNYGDNEQVEYVLKQSESKIGGINETEFDKKFPFKWEGKKLYGIITGQSYRHFAGKIYYTLEISQNLLTGENMVECYEENNSGYAKSTDRYIMPIADFFANISDEYPDDVNIAKQKYRFELISDFDQEYYQKNVKWYPAKEKLNYEIF